MCLAEREVLVKQVVIVRTLYEIYPMSGCTETAVTYKDFIITCLRPFSVLVEPRRRKLHCIVDTRWRRMSFIIPCRIETLRIRIAVSDYIRNGNRHPEREIG